jgi:protein SCO1
VKTAVAIATAAVVGILLGIGVHSATNGGGSVESRPPAEVRPAAGVRGQAVWPAGFRRAPDFSLPDSEGHRFSLASVRGEPAIITFMDSRCHQQCPLEGRTLAAGFRLVPKSQRPIVIAVSVNPWEDTPASARRAIGRFGLAGFRWRWLLGSRAQLEDVWRKYGIAVKRTAGDVAHTDALYLVDSRGFERAGMVYPFLPTWISTDLKLLAG